MLRERSEIISFTRDDLERIVRHIAQLNLVGHLFIGKFGQQEVQWLPDGAVEVVTRYQQGAYDDLPPAPPAPVEMAPLPAIKKPGRR